MENCAYGKQKLCGRVLTEVLATVCVNGFNYRIKRCCTYNEHNFQSILLEFISIILVEKEEQEEPELPKIIPPDGSWYHRLKDILQKMEDDINENEPEIIEIDQSDREVEVIGTKGVADECCTNGCVLADIIMYCA